MNGHQTPNSPSSTGSGSSLSSSSDLGEEFRKPRKRSKSRNKAVQNEEYDSGECYHGRFTSLQNFFMPIDSGLKTMSLFKDHIRGPVVECLLSMR